MRPANQISLLEKLKPGVVEQLPQCGWAGVTNIKLSGVNPGPNRESLWAGERAERNRRRAGERQREPEQKHRLPSPFWHLTFSISLYIPFFFLYLRKSWARSSQPQEPKAKCCPKPNTKCPAALNSPLTSKAVLSFSAQSPRWHQSPIGSFHSDVPRKGTRRGWNQFS